MEPSILDLNTPQARSEIGGKVRGLRQGKGMSQQRLATRCGVRQNVVSRVENGDRCLELSLIVKIAEGLRVPVAALLPSRIARLLGDPLQALNGLAGRSGASTCPDPGEEHPGDPPMRRRAAPARLHRSGAWSPLRPPKGESS